MNYDGNQIIFLSNRMSIVLDAKINGYRSLIIRGAKKKYSHNLCEKVDIFETRIGLLTEEDVKNGFSQISIFFDRFLAKNKVDCFFFWNGSSFLSRVSSAYVQTRGYKCLFFEISNFTGKLFVDPFGVNIRSWFANNYKKFRHLKVDNQQFFKWRDDYLAKKLVSHNPPQAQISNNFNWLYPLDLIGFYFASAPYSERPQLFRRTWQYLCSKRTKYFYDDFRLNKGEYIFFPLQVTTDSQLLWNSKIDNLQALQHAFEVAHRENKKLVVKPHPAEGNRLFVSRLAKLRSKFDFLFVNDNTFLLMKNSHKVITINSTAGIEAMLLGKTVIILGSSFYSNFNNFDLAYYIQNYLLDIDFFSNDSITEEQMNNIFLRMEINRES